MSGKRGRKPKLKETPPENPDQKILKKRGRRKKCDIDSVSKISGFSTTGNSIDTVGDKLKFSTDNKLNESNNVQTISFGKFNIGIQNASQNASQNESIITKFKEKNRSNNNLCNIDVPLEEYDSEEENENESIINNINNDDSLSYHKKRAANVLLKKKPTKKSNETVWKENSNDKLSMVLENFRGENNKLNWPDKTNINCWWCCHSFNGSPKTLPYRYDELRKRFKVMGVFCTWECSKAYAMNDNSFSTRYTISLLDIFVKQIYGKYVYIKTAPPRQSLIMFGGKLTIEEFRSPDMDVTLHSTNCVLDPSVYFSWSKYNSCTTK